MAATDPRGVGMIGLLDTNVALYFLGGKLAETLPRGDYGISVITEMELLAWPSLTAEEEARVQEFLDAIVCATALEYELPLWTNDARLASVAGLVSRGVRILP